MPGRQNGCAAPAFAMGSADAEPVHPLWGYDDLADYERRCLARDTHPDFPAYLNAPGHLITAQETQLIRAAMLAS